MKTKFPELQTTNIAHFLRLSQTSTCPNNDGPILANSIYSIYIEIYTNSIYIYSNTVGQV